MTDVPVPGSRSGPAASATGSRFSAALETLVARATGAIRAIGFRYGLDRAEQDEFEQDIRIRLWHALERQGEKLDTLPTSYVRDAAVSSAVDLLRRRRRDQRLLSFDEVAPPEAADPAPAERLAEVLEGALATLALDRRAVVRMHLDGRARADIEAATGWTEARVRNLLYRGLDDLRGALSRGSRQ